MNELETIKTMLALINMGERIEESTLSKAKQILNVTLDMLNSFVTEVREETLKQKFS